jgi:hypothetical protein
MVVKWSKATFFGPVHIHRDAGGPFVVSEAKGVALAYVHCRDDLQGIDFAHNHLTSEEARRIANGIARLPELMMQRKDFNQRGKRTWKKSRPYHVALEDVTFARIGGSSMRSAKMNGIPFDGTGERIERDGMWYVYEFAVQARRDSILGPLRRTMASRRRVHLSRSSERVAAASRGT